MLLKAKKGAGKRNLIILLVFMMLLISCNHVESNSSNLSTIITESTASSKPQEAPSSTSSSSKVETTETFESSTESQYVSSIESIPETLPPQSIQTAPIPESSEPDPSVPPHDFSKLIITSDKSTYSVDDSITITLTNTDDYTYLYRPAYHLQQFVDGNWVTLTRAADRNWESVVWLPLVSGETLTCNFYLYIEYENLSAGKYRFYLEGTFGALEPSFCDPYFIDESGFASIILEFTTEFEIE